MSDAVLIEAILGAVRSVNVYRTVLSVACAIVTWELVIHLHRELRTIWRKRFNPISVGYVISRYWTIVALFGDLYLSFWPHGDISNCSKVVLWTQYSPIPALFAAGFLATMRVNAVWYERKAVNLFLLACMVFVMTVQITIPLLLKGPRNSSFPPGVTACLLADTTSDNRFLLYFASPLPFDVAAFVLASNAALGPWRLGREKLIDMLRSHQIHLFALAWASTLINVIYYGTVAHKSEKNSTLLGTVTIAMHSIAVCRMVLNCGDKFQLPYKTEPSSVPVSHRQSLLPATISTYPPLAAIRHQSWGPTYAIGYDSGDSADAHLRGKTDTF